MRAKKSLGQNFLRDPAVTRRIVDSLGILPDDLVIEIGPGRGALTEILVETDASILAVELDRDLVPVLSERFGSYPNFSVIEADFLSTDFDNLIGSRATESVKIVGNLPYYISTPIIQKLIKVSSRFSHAVLMLQREVVDRLTAKPGNSDRAFITVLTEDAFEAEKLFDVPPNAFFPVPKVWSSVMKLTPANDRLSNHPVFEKLVSAGFAQKRKTILNNLKYFTKNAGELLKLSGIEPLRRAETLTLAEWKQLSENLLKTDKIDV